MATQADPVELNRTAEFTKVLEGPGVISFMDTAEVEFIVADVTTPPTAEATAYHTVSDGFTWPSRETGTAIFMRIKNASKVPVRIAVTEMTL